MTEHLMTQEGHLTDLTLERLLLDDLSPTELEAAQAHIAECEACRADLESLRADTAAYFEEAPATWRPPRPQDVREPRLPAKRARPWRRAAFGLAAACLLTLGLLPLLPRPQESVDPGIRSKGAVMRVEVFVQDGQTTRVAMQGESVRPGDRLGFKLFTRQSGWLMIVGWDKTQELYVGYPQNEDDVRAERVEPTPLEGQALGAALELDEVLGEERLLAILCPEPFTFEQVRRELAQALASKQPPRRPGCEHHETSLQKRAAPKEPE